MMRKYNDTPLVARHPSLIPGFLFLLPVIGEALKPFVTEGQVFPQYVPPAPLGDWIRLDATEERSE